MPGHGRAPAAFYIGRRARNGSGDGNAAEKGADDVGDPLRHQFLIGIVLVVNHAVRHHRAQERFNGGQQRDGQGGLEQDDGMLSQENAGKCGAGKPCGMPPNFEPMVSTGR